MDKGRKFNDRNFAVASFKYNRWSLDLEEHQSIDDALEPSNWGNLAARIMGHDKTDPKGRGDIIEVRKIDNGLYAEMMVTEVSQGFVRVRLLRNQEVVAVTTLPEDSPLATKWNPGKKLHEIVRVSDKTVLHPGFQTKERSVAWIVDHISKIAA